MTEIVNSEKKWKEVITPEHNIWTFPFREIWNYRDLLMIWMRRDILSIYKQTLLGPLWFIVQPILTTLTYFIIFSRLGKFSTGGLPPILFYMSGIILWAYFAESLTKVSNFFRDSTPVLSKVYFPRIIIPISIVMTNLVKFGIQFLLYLIIFFYYYFTSATVQPTIYLALFPVLLLMTGILSLASGMIISSMTVRYKDLGHLVVFGVQLMMFLSPVFFPLSAMENNIYAGLIKVNPMTGIIEAFRFGFTGKGYFSWELIGYDFAFMVVLFFFSTVIFNKVEKNFVDVI